MEESAYKIDVSGCELESIAIAIVSMMAYRSAVCTDICIDHSEHLLLIDLWGMQNLTFLPVIARDQEYL